MKVYKAIVTFSDQDEGYLQKCDVIKYENAFWLVPKWLEKIATGERAPERIVCLSNIPHQRNPSGVPADFVVSSSIPISVFEGKKPEESDVDYLIVENPEIPDSRLERGVH